MIGNLQYAWTMCVQPMMSATDWKLSEVQWGFTVFIAVMTWTMPLSGWLIDRLGPRTVHDHGRACCAARAGLARLCAQPSRSSTRCTRLPDWAMLSCTAARTALGLKWFPDKRGVASGLIAAGYGSGAAVFNPFFGYLIRSDGLSDHLSVHGLALGVVDPDRRPIPEISADGIHPRAAARRAAEDPPAGRTVQFAGDAADAAVLCALT